ncbi:lyase family protein [Thalassovita sp.]|jgi:3-carboxy-cis,cis-muconate cycloisomerase|uniref:lyase family protein n=1 Tax=Thalassovita sp. TaxID=1979401 RepID=UPI003B5BBC2A
MAASVFSSELFTRLFPVGEAGRLFTDSAEVRSLQLVMGTLAKVQGQMGIIPEASGLFIHRAALEIPLDPGGLAAATGQNGVSIPGLVETFRKAMEAPEHAQYLHWGATSQDIIDTAQSLRLRQFLTLMDKGLTALLQDMATLAKTHAALPMPARTWGQQATPTSFGAVVAGWGAPLLDLRAELPALRQRAIWVSLSGAAGTSSAMGDNAPELRAELAKALNLTDPGRSWHSDRGPILAVAAWLTRLTAALAKCAEDLLLLTQTEIAEVSLGGAGSSSTMPQKQNPVAASAVVALARSVTGLNVTLQGAGAHRQERDGAAWMTEWMTLPPLSLSAASALEHAQALLSGLAPNPDAMQAALQSNDLIHAEALSFRLAEIMPRPEAQAATKELCQQARTGAGLAAAARAAYPDLALDDIFDPVQQMGQAPALARAFADCVGTKS